MVATGSETITSIRSFRVNKEMNTIRNLFLLASIALVILGAFLQGIRPIAIPLGFGLLLAGYVFEKAFRRNRRYHLAELSMRSDQKGTISVEKSQLLVSDNWSLDRCLTLDGFDGCYSVEILERFRDDFALISKIKIMNNANLSGELRSEVTKITVDTGWLLFLASSAVDKFQSKELEQLIQGELKTLPSNRPLFIWLKNTRAAVGIVVSTGEGDGVYQIESKTKGGKLLAIETDFISASSVGSEAGAYRAHL
jgi:hypothetical protein